MPIKKKNFVEVEYTGKTKDEGFVFDTTDEKKAKETGIFSQQQAYGPVTVCIGEGQILPGLEKKLEGKDPGKYTFELGPEEAFGKKDAKLIKMIPFSVFKKQNIAPQVGMQINVDGMMGIIKTASGGRCMVDFNHPLSGKHVIYEIKVNSIVTKDLEKVKAYISLALNMKDTDVLLNNEKYEIVTKSEVPKEVQEKLIEKLKELIPTVTDVSFTKAKPTDSKK